ncbi:MAG TPA: GPP34 family phosphoprotein [Micromonosporaceae bacterium]|jgi:hypothetical protein|nr:GPP34 family phosphoprotein [Micromonosporaceae bacterium]
MPLVDDFYLLAHDERGKTRLHARATAIGLAAGVLAELLLTGHIMVRDGNVLPAAPAPDWSTVDPQGVGRSRQPAPPPDPLGHTIWDQIWHEPNRHHIRTWLSGLAPTITEAVATRMVRVGTLDAVEVGRIRRTTRYVPADSDAGTKVKVVLAARLVRQDTTLDWPDAVLCGLLVATGLIADVLWQDTTGVGRRYLDHVLRGVAGQMPAFADLFADTEAAVGDAVLAHRT